MKNKQCLTNIIQIITTLILLATMLFIWQQTQISNDEYKIRNKPIVGVEGGEVILLLPEGDERIGKPISWNEAKSAFICDNKPTIVEGCVIKIKVKNFGTEPALDLNVDSEICIGNTSIKTTDPEFKSSIIMPNQIMLNSPTISKQNLYDAFLEKKQIRLKYKFKYSDLTRREDLFEYSAEILIWDTKNISLRIVDAQILDKRF